MAAAAAAAAAYCERHGLKVYVQDACQLYAAAGRVGSVGSAAEADSFLASYFTAVACGQHVLWRPYAFVSATHANRKALLAAAQRSLAPLAAAGRRISLGDAASLLQLLCPDFPQGTVRNAWTPALAIQQWLDVQQQQQQAQQQQAQQQQAQQQQAQQQQDPSAPAGPGTAAAAACGGGGGDSSLLLVRLPVFRQCLEVTFVYEQHLLALRKGAFDGDKRCVSLQQLEAAMAAAAEALPPRGWPVIPERCLKQAITQASRAATYPDFAFGELVRALCCCQELVRAVRQELSRYQEAAAAAAAAVSCPPTSRQSSSSDE